MELGTEVKELGPEHADGTIWADIEGDLWFPCPIGWVTVRRMPFEIRQQVAHPYPLYGPYRAVLGPPTPR